MHQPVRPPLQIVGNLSSNPRTSNENIICPGRAGRLLCWTTLPTKAIIISSTEAFSPRFHARRHAMLTRQTLHDEGIFSMHARTTEILLVPTNTCHSNPNPCKLLKVHNVQLGQNSIPSFLTPVVLCWLPRHGMCENSNKDMEFLNTVDPPQNLRESETIERWRQVASDRHQCQNGNYTVMHPCQAACNALDILRAPHRQMGRLCINSPSPVHHYGQRKL